jgi:hypothetical protein
MRLTIGLAALTLSGALQAADVTLLPGQSLSIGDTRVSCSAQLEIVDRECECVSTSLTPSDGIERRGVSAVLRGYGRNSGGLLWTRVLATYCTHGACVEGPWSSAWYPADACYAKIAADSRCQ